MKKHIILVISLFIIFTGKLYSQECVAAKFSFDSTEHDFGKIKEEKGMVTHRFNFTNIGKAPLLISSVKVTCGCSVSDWSKEPIAPGAKGYVDASFNPQGRPGMFFRTYTVVSNADNSEFPLKINGEVIPEKTIDTKLPEIKFKTTNYTFQEKEGIKVKYVYQFENTGQETLEITDVKSSCDCVKATIKSKSILPGDAGEIEVNFDTKNEEGNHYESITVLSNAKNQEKVVLKFSGKVYK